MAEFFKKISDGVSKAANNVKDSVETAKKRAKLKKQISDAKNKIKSIELEMGEAIYNAYKNGSRPESFSENCKEIDSLLVEIKIVEAKLLELDGIRLCEKCSAQIPVDSVFCSKCGVRQTRMFDDDDVIAEDNSDDEDNMISL